MNLIRQTRNKNKTLFFLCYTCFALLISNVKTDTPTPTLYQMIWYESTSSYKKIQTAGNLLNMDYHEIKTLFGNTIVTYNSAPTNYLALIKRDNGATSTEEIIYKDKDDIKYSMFPFFLLNLKGNHIKSRKYIMWDVICDSTTGIVTYNIKFFTCDDELNYFDTNLNANIKVKNYGNSMIVSVGTGSITSDQITAYLTTNSCKSS